MQQEYDGDHPASLGLEAAAAAAAKLLQSCPTLGDPTDGSPPGSPRPWDSPVFLPGESQGRGEPGGLPSVGSPRVGHD